MFSIKNLTVCALAALAAVAPAAAEDSRMRRPRGDRPEDPPPRTRGERGERRPRPMDPPRMRDGGMYGEEMGMYGEYGACMDDILTVAAGIPELSTLVFLLVEASGRLDEELDPSYELTALLPSNEAFANFGEEAVGELVADPEAFEHSEKEHVCPAEYRIGTQVYQRHIIAEAVLNSADLMDGMVIESQDGQMLTVGVDESGVTFTTEAGTTARVVVADIPACQSVIHIIDAVLEP